MRRREFLTGLAWAVAAWPRATRAQQAEKTYRIGILEQIPAERNAANLAALRKGLRDLGYIEGRNLVIEYLMILSSASTVRDNLGSIPASAAALRSARESETWFGAPSQASKTKSKPN